MATELDTGASWLRWKRAALMALPGALVFAGCARLPHLASGPIELGPTPVLVRFEAPVRASLDDFTLCFEFRLPRESDEARRIVATLVTSAQQRHVFASSELDRRGEFVVCRVGHMAPSSEPPAPGAQTPHPSTPTAPLSFTAVELKADPRLRLRGLRGGPTAEAS